MKLSVVIPCYNFERYIEQCLLSVVSQKTNFDFEILVGDDCSTDTSFEKIERVRFFNNFYCVSGDMWGEKENNPCKIKVIRHPENIGGYLNLDSLISSSSGEYIAYLDGDDYFTDPYKLQKQVDFLDENPDYVMTFTGYWKKNFSDQYCPENIIEWMGFTKRGDGEVTTEDLLETNYVTFGKVFRNLFKGKPRWDEDVKYGDWMLAFEISKFGKIKFLNYPTGVYREHSNGVFTSLDSEQRETAYRECQEKIKNNYDKYILENGKRNL